MGGIDTVIPVDCYVPGCAARPEAIIDGVVAGLGALAAKRAAMDVAVSQAKLDKAQGNTPLEQTKEVEAND
jgi:ech hydrogenase subunit C